MDQAGRRGTAQRMLVARASRHVAGRLKISSIFNRSAQYPGTHPDVPIFLKAVLSVDAALAGAYYIYIGAPREARCPE
jgi:hypothetical protein